MKQIACPACTSTALSILTAVKIGRGRDKMSGEILRCHECSHRFMPTTPEQQDLIETNYDAHYAGYRHDHFFARRIRQAISDELLPLTALGGSVLDVGCGSGEFLVAAREYGLKVSGVDVSESAAAACRERGIVARAGDFLNLQFEEQYDLVTMWDVVEHLREPESFIRRSAELLKPGGHLVLKIPGFGRFTFYPIKLYHRLACQLLGAPAHVQYFTPRSLEALLARCGFTQVKWFPSRSFRSAPAATGWKKTIGRALTWSVKTVSGDRNLYLAAAPFAPARPAEDAHDNHSGRRIGGL